MADSIGQDAASAMGAETYVGRHVALSVELLDHQYLSGRIDENCGGYLQTDPSRRGRDGHEETRTSWSIHMPFSNNRARDRQGVAFGTDATRQDASMKRRKSSLKASGASKGGKCPQPSTTCSVEPVIRSTIR